jgi:hypothetical protein
MRDEEIECLPRPAPPAPRRQRDKVVAACVSEDVVVVDARVCEVIGRPAGHYLRSSNGFSTTKRTEVRLGRGFVAASVMSTRRFGTG